MKKVIEFVGSLFEALVGLLAIVLFGAVCILVLPILTVGLVCAVLVVMVGLLVYGEYPRKKKCKSKNCN